MSSTETLNNIICNMLIYWKKGSKDSFSSFAYYKCTKNFIKPYNVQPLLHFLRICSRGETVKIIERLPMLMDAPHIFFERSKCRLGEILYIVYDVDLLDFFLNFRRWDSHQISISWRWYKHTLEFACFKKGKKIAKGWLNI